MKRALLLAGLAFHVTLASAQTPAADANPAVRTEVESVVGALKLGLANETKSDELSIFLMDMERGTVSLVVDQVSRELTYCGTPSWASDGRRIVFDATPKEGYARTRMQMIEVAGGRAKLVDLGAGNCPAVAPDGKRVAFMLNPGAVPGEEAGMWLMQADGSARQRLQRIDLVGVPKWSPDGQRLLVTVLGSPSRMVLIRVTDPERPVLSQVQVEGGVFYSVGNWTGAGLTMVAVLKLNGKVDIALVDVSDPAHAQVKQSLWRNGDGLTIAPIFPAYHPESGRCAFVGRDGNATALYAFNAKQGEKPKRIEVPGFGGKVASLAFSPDGRYLLFCSQRMVGK